MTPEEIARRLQPLAQETAGLRLLVLVGSHARGEARERSDIDLAMIADDRLDLGRFIGEVTIALQTDDVDVADLDRANGLFRYEAARDGRLINGDQEEWNAFRFAALTFWYDAGPTIMRVYEQRLASLG